MKQIFEDAEKISKYLGINCPKLKLNPNTTEGLTLEKITHLGTKGGYRRKLLIHELLHTKGLQHTYPSNFFNGGNIDECELSKFVEQQVFGDSLKEIRQFKEEIQKLKYDRVDLINRCKNEYDLKQKLDEKDMDIESLQLHYDSMFGIKQDLQQKLEQIKDWAHNDLVDKYVEDRIKEILEEKT